MIFTAVVFNSAEGPFFFPPTASGDPSAGEGNNGAYSFATMAVPLPVACTFDSMYVNPQVVPAGEGGGGAISVTLYTGMANDASPTATALTVNAISGTQGVTPATPGSITGQSVGVSAGTYIALYLAGSGLTNGEWFTSVSMHCQ
jgi:hypothetical protein